MEIIDTRDSKDGRTPLHYLLSEDIIDELLSEGADINATDDDSRMHPHDAAYSGLKYMIDGLLEAEASVSAIEKDGQTPVYVAASRKLPPLGVSSCNVGYYGLSVSYTP